MNDQLSEEEMRAALFGTGDSGPREVSQRAVRSPAKLVSSNSGSKIRVNMHVSNEFEGAYEVVSYESSNLSRLVVEMDAKKKFKKKFRYVEVVSVERI